MGKKTYEQAATEGKHVLAKVGEAKTIITQEIPKPQSYLSPAGKKIFKAICTHLIEHNTLCSIDGLYISSIALNMDLFVNMATLIAEKEASLAKSMKIWERVKDTLEEQVLNDASPELYEELKAHYKAKPGDGGYFQTFPNGVVQNSPYVNTMNKAFDIIEKGCQKLGMTPYSRDKILAFAKIGEPEGDDDDELDLVARVQQALKNKIGQS